MFPYPLATSSIAEYRRSHLISEGERARLARTATATSSNGKAQQLRARTTITTRRALALSILAAISVGLSACGSTHQPGHTAVPLAPGSPPLSTPTPASATTNLQLVDKSW